MVCGKCPPSDDQKAQYLQVRAYIIRIYSVWPGTYLVREVSNLARALGESILLSRLGRASVPEDRFSNFVLISQIVVQLSDKSSSIFIPLFTCTQPHPQLPLWTKAA